MLTQAALANFFRAYGRERILKALDENPDPIAEAKAKIKSTNRTAEDLLPVLSLPPGQAHRTAAATYQNRSIAEGKCCDCPEPLARNSVRYCETHLKACRERARARAKEPQAAACPSSGNSCCAGRRTERSRGRNEPLTGTDREAKIKGAPAVRLMRPL
jgi:hypothetical protein